MFNTNHFYNKNSVQNHYAIKKFWKNKLQHIFNHNLINFVIKMFFKAFLLINNVDQINCNMFTIIILSIRSSKPLCHSTMLKRSTATCYLSQFYQFVTKKFVPNLPACQQCWQHVVQHIFNHNSDNLITKMLLTNYLLSNNVVNINRKIFYIIIPLIS